MPLSIAKGRLANLNGTSLISTRYLTTIIGLQPPLLTLPATKGQAPSPPRRRLGERVAA